MQNSTINAGNGAVVQKGESSNGNGNDNSSETQCGVLPPMAAGANPINKKTLVLDLDGTLVHVTTTPMKGGYDFSITFKGRERPSFYVLKRPGVDELLQQLGATGLYEIVVFTAASRIYANALVDCLLDSLPETDSSHNNGNRNIIPRSHRLASEYCRKVEGVHHAVKDLSLLGRDLKNVIFVDDRPSSYYLQPRNAIPIKLWKGNNYKDKTLFKILSFCLENADSTTDVRDLISDYLS